jgi:carboxyl-terminal processing protease
MLHMAVCLLLIVWGALMPSGPCLAQGIEPPDSITSSPAQIMHQAMGLIKNQALVSSPSPREMRLILRSYVRGLDPYSDYLSPAEYRIFQGQSSKHYAGVGMDIMPLKEGGVICLPIEGGPADLAGVKPGDLLLAVDERTVAGQSHYIVGNWILGPAGSKVMLTLKRDSLRVKLDIRRKRLIRRTVKLSWLPGRAARIQISRFIKGTAQELRNALNQAGGAPYVVLDLQNCPGGDLREMIRTASLFLEPETPLFSLRTRKGNRIIRAMSVTAPFRLPLVIWQNQATASAAEALIMALTLHRRAASLGWTSHGKGSVQKIIPLEDRSALIITSAMIQDPQGWEFHGKGLVADYPLPKCRQSCSELLIRKTKEIMGYVD